MYCTITSKAKINVFFHALLSLSTTERSLLTFKKTRWFFAFETNSTGSLNCTFWISVHCEIPKCIIGHFFNEIVTHVNFGQVYVFEGFALDFWNLIFCQINCVDETKISKHLKFNFCKLISRQIHCTNSEKKAKYFIFCIKRFF